MTDHDARIAEIARKLWTEAGKPEGRDETYRDLATEIVAQEENYLSTTRPVGETTETPVEPIESLENQGEFPTLTDQGEMKPPRR